MSELPVSPRTEDRQSELFVERIVVAGTLLGKERYRHSYPLRTGMVFHAAYHEAGLQKIKEELFAEGYCAASVRAVSVPNDARHTVAITITIDPGERFVIGKQNLKLTAPKGMPAREKERLVVLIKSALHEHSAGTSYERSLLNGITAQLRQMLIEQGYIASSIRLQEVIDRVKKRVDLTFIVTLGGKKLFLFHGNKSLSRAQLLEPLLLFGDALALIPPTCMVDELAQLYRRHGFWNVQIQVDQVADQLLFFIFEGSRGMIRSVQLEGVTTFSPDEVVRRCFGTFLQGANFDEAVVQQAFASLLAYYQQEGFWDVKIKQYRYHCTGCERYELQVVVEEGVRTMLRRSELAAQFPLNIKLPYADLSEAIPFDRNYIDVEKRRLFTELRRDGRLYAIPTPRLRREDAASVLVWDCAGMDEQVRFGKTIIQPGSIDPDLIMRELACCEGMVWSPPALELTVARLKDLGIFDAVSLVPDDISRAEKVKDLLIQYSADTRYEARLRAGIQGVNRNIVKWNGGLSYKAGGSFLAKNVTGRADLLRVDLDYSRYMHEMACAYRIPWLFNVRLRTEWKLFSSRYDQPMYIGSPEVLYRARNEGFLMEVGNRVGMLTGAVKGGVAWQGLQAARCDGCSPSCCKRSAALAETLILDPAFINHQYPYFFIEPTLVFDVRDDKVNTNTGTLTMFTLKLALPHGIERASFLKLLLEQSAFFYVYGPVVCGIRMRMGTVLHAPFDRILPTERFYLGGSHSLRGYNADYAPPLNHFTTCSGKECLVPIGGKSMLNLNGELRFPLYGPLSGVTFIDIGMLSCAPCPAIAQPHSLMGDIGFGLRFNTAIGPLRFDLGWKFKQDRTVRGDYVHDKQFAWFLTLGQAF